MKILITEKQLKKVIVEIKTPEVERVKIYQDERILVVAPLTHRASCKYGANTKWCAAAVSNNEPFDDYQDNGCLIYFIIKSPHPDAKIKEYKFAYFHPFNNDYEESKGWYDMSDYQFGVKPQSDDEREPDMKLVKFLIPDFIFDKVKEYFKVVKKEYLKRTKLSIQSLYNFFINDPDNLLITADNDWTIGYRLKDFNEKYTKEFPNLWFPPVHPIHHLLHVYFVDKLSHKIYAKNYDFQDDIRNSTIPTHREIYFRVSELNRNEDVDLDNVTKKYYKPISKAFFTLRKEYFNPPSNHNYIKLMPDFVTVGDKQYNAWGNGDTVVSIEKGKSSHKPYEITLKSVDGKINKNPYYSLDSGMFIEYDPIKHNPI